MRLRLFLILVALAVAPSATQAFGALAIDTAEGTKFGWWAGASTKQHAATQALNSCGAGCRIVAQWQGGCTAYAVDRAIGRGHISFIGSGLNGQTARANATRGCSDRGGINCQVRVWACDTGANAGTGGGLTSGPSVPPPGKPTHEPNIDRPGGDFSQAALPAGTDWPECKRRCDANTFCKAWTYVRAGAQGPSPRCWLKNSVPARVSNTCCTSGVK